MHGYVNSKDPFIKIKNKMFYPTGDMVELNKDNEYIFRGRNKDYIKLDGYRIDFNDTIFIPNISQSKLPIELVSSIIG